MWTVTLHFTQKKQTKTNQKPRGLVKSCNLKHYYKTKHRHFEDSSPQLFEVRTQKINKLKAQYERSSRVLSPFLSAQ